MTRLILASAAWLSLVSVTSASLSPRMEPSTRCDRVPPAKAFKFPAQAITEATEPGNRSEFVLTAQTEILLNGAPCKYEQVPAHANIVRMEVAADKITVLKIHFRTGK